MRYTIKYFIAAAIFISSAYSIKAQQVADVKFGDLLEQMIKPASTMKETAQSYPDFESVEKELNLTNGTIDENLAFIYNPLLEQFRDYQAKTADKSLMARLSADEKDLLHEFQVTTAGLSEKSLQYSFRLLMMKRPLAAASSTSWTRIHAPLTPAGKGIYQKLLAAEKLLGKPVNKAEHSTLLTDLGMNDAEADEVDAELRAALDNLPRKKVKHKAENIITEMEDPVKAIELCKQYEARRQKIFQKRYTEQYRSWQTQFQKLTAAGSILDSLLSNTTYGERLSGNDKQLKTIMADVQARALETLYRLLAETRKVLMDGQISEWTRKTTEHTIATYNDFEVVAK